MAVRWRILLIVPLVALLIGPLYAGRRPDFLGIAFFYWYELACVLLAAALSWLVYRPKHDGGPAAAPQEPRFSRDPAIRRRPARSLTRAR